MVQEINPNTPPNISIEPLGPQHDRAAFVCREPALTAYFNGTAEDRTLDDDLAMRLIRPFVMIDDDTKEVLGFFTLSNSGISRKDLTNKYSRGQYPVVPVMLLGRMALHSKLKGQNLGGDLLWAALRQAHKITGGTGCYAVIVDAKNDWLVEWYKEEGFVRMERATEARRMFMLMADIEEAIKDESEETSVHEHEDAQHEPAGIFVPSHGGFMKLGRVPGNGSINSVSEHLRYHTDQVYSYLGDFDTTANIQIVILELFSRNIVAVITRKTVTDVDEEELRYFLRDLDATLFDSYNVNASLTDGIANQSLSSTFLARVLEMEDVESNGIYFSDKLGMYLHFSNGVLTDFQASDGLNHWAKHWKQLNPTIIQTFEDEARRYWGNNDQQVMHEINVQSDALARLPEAVDNKFLLLHPTTSGMPNFFMALVCHYNYPITLSEFKVLNHSRYERLSDNNGLELYQAGLFTFEFTGEKLLKTYLSE